MEELYENLYGNNFIHISDDFLTEYMPDVKPEYLKVFLFYLWKGAKGNYTVEEAADEIDMEEHIVEMALKYWINKKLIKSECLRTKKDSDKASNLVDFTTKKSELINKNKKDYSEIETNLLFVAEKLLGQTLSDRQQALIAKCYNDYCFDEGLIHYLLEYCSNISTDARYMGRIAESWYEQKVKTTDDAKKIVERIESGKKVNLKKNVTAKKIDRNEYNKLFAENFINTKFK